MNYIKLGIGAGVAWGLAIITKEFVMSAASASLKLADKKLGDILDQMRANAAGREDEE